MYVSCYFTKYASGDTQTVKDHTRSIICVGVAALGWGLASKTVPLKISVQDSM